MLHNMTFNDTRDFYPSESSASVQQPCFFHFPQGSCGYIVEKANISAGQLLVIR